MGALVDGDCVVGVGCETVTVAVDDTLPCAFWAASVYVVVAVGDTTVDPLAATLVPFNVTVVAFVVDQVTVLDCPARIDVGEAETVAVGTDAVVVDVEVDVLVGGEVDGDLTVTVVETIVVPTAFVAVRK